MLAVLTLALSLSSLVAAQSNSSSDFNGALEIEAIEAHFTNADLVPDLLSAFNPSSVMNVSYSTSVGAISPGQMLTQDRASLY